MNACTSVTDHTWRLNSEMMQVVRSISVGRDNQAFVQVVPHGGDD